MIELTLSVMPPSVNGLWINKPNGRYKSKKGKEFEKIARTELLKQYRGKVLARELKVRIRLFFKTNHTRDIDNYNKAILDSMSGIVFLDDSQITELNINKYTGCGFDKVEIEIEEMEIYESCTGNIYIAEKGNKWINRKKLKKKDRCYLWIVGGKQWTNYKF